MRFVKISQAEFGAILKLYESIMSYACHGILFREGETVGEELAELCTGKGDLLDCAKKLLVARGWADDITFDKEEVRVKGSIEVLNGSEKATCHRLRGIFSRLYCLYNRKRIMLVENECSSTGSPECVFRIEVS